VEFALVIVFLIVFLLSFIEITALVYTYSVWRFRQGRRALRVVHGTLIHLQRSGSSWSSL